MNVSPETSAAPQDSIRNTLLGGRLSISELAQMLGCGERTIYYMISRGLPYVKVAGKRYVRPEDFAAMLDRDEQNKRLRRRSASAA